MHKFLFNILGCVFFSILTPSLQAQSYRPFIPHLTYVYECHYKARTNEPDIKGAYGFKIDSVYSTAMDSVFRFNQIARGLGEICPYQDNIMGGMMIQKSNGDYQFVANEFDTTLIRTQLPLQSTWAYDSITTATLVARAEQDVLGQLDSVLVISLSSGDSIVLSKTFGLVNAQAILPIEHEHYLDSYTFADSMRSPLLLIGIDELGLGQAYFNRRDFYDFEIGDVFLYRTSSSCNSEIFTYRWERVLDRRESLDGDTLYYDYEIEQITITPHTASPLPPGHPGDTTHQGFYTITQTIELSQWDSPPKLLSYEYDIPSGYHLQGPYFGPRWDDDLSYVFNPLGSENPNTNCYFNFEGGQYYTFTEGLGATVYSIGGPSPVICKQLIAYQKSTDSAGVWLEPQMLVSNESELAASSLKLYPNPSDRFVQIEFCAEQAIQDWQLKLIDIQGRLVQQTSGFEASNCLSYELDIRDLSQGFYMLQMLSSKASALQTQKLTKY